MNYNKLREWLSEQEHIQWEHWSKEMPVVNLVRRLIPVECERLQGFPDNWTQGVSDTQRYKQLGNAVTVNVIEAIMLNILDSYS